MEMISLPLRVPFRAETRGAETSRSGLPRISLCGIPRSAMSIRPVPRSCREEMQRLLRAWPHHDPLGGILTADAASEFVGADELRFYLPRRASNQIATGALLNEVSFPGARIDPSDTQRYDEFVVHITGDVDSSPNQHANSFTSGAAPTTNPAGYGFYYDTISLIAGIGRSPSGGPGGGTGGGPGSGNSNT